MAGVTAQGASFTFRGVAATVTSISVETPIAEIVNMTSARDPANYLVLVPTGAWSGGSITVDYIHRSGGTDPQTLVGYVGSLQFSSSGYSVTRNAILESATHGAQVGDLVKGTLKFRMTDYFPN
jgi:hypothetical protein